MHLPITGGCQCGAVRFEIRAEPLTVYCCHCTECQRQSSSAFGMSVVVPRDAFVVTKGTPAQWTRTHESGRQIDCLFCPTCGSRICHNPHANAKATIARAGLFDDTTWVDPVGHIWTSSTQAWFPLPADRVLYEGQPPDMAKLIAAWQERPGEAARA